MSDREIDIETGGELVVSEDRTPSLFARAAFCASRAVAAALAIASIIISQ